MKTKNRVRDVVLWILALLGALYLYYLVQGIIGEFVYQLVEKGFLSEQFTERYYFLDSISCVFLISFYGIWYYILKSKEKKMGNGLQKPLQDSFFIPKIVILILGVGGISSMWLDLVDRILSVIPVFSNSLENFNGLWENAAHESYIWEFLSVAFLGPIVEELLHRGLIYNYIRKIKGEWVAVIGSSLIFGIWHGELVQCVYTVIAGLAFAIVYKKTGSLKYSIGIHILNNFLTTLPPAWNTDFTYIAIDGISRAMALPALAIFILMVTNDRNTKETHLLTEEEI